MELSKSDKRTARDIIKKGMLAEIQRGLHQAGEILQRWKAEQGNPQEAYHELYQHISTFDKGIAQRYDGLKNDTLLYVLVWQVREGLVDRQELDALSEDGKVAAERILSL